MELSSIQQALVEVELSLLNGFCQENEITKSLCSLVDVNERLKIVKEASCSESECGHEIFLTASRIFVIAETLLALENREEDTERITKGMLRDTENIFVEDKRQAHSIQQVSTTSDSSDTLPAHFMREFFLANLDSPYPTQKDKNDLLSKTNDGATMEPSESNNHPLLNPNQLTLWFINARRRSGWSSILQKFAKNDKSLMKALMRKMVHEMGFLDDIKAADSGPVDDTPIEKLLLPEFVPEDPDCIDYVEQFQEDFKNMVLWIKLGVKERVGDWMDEIISKTKKSDQRGVTSSSPNARSPTKGSYDSNLMENTGRSGNGHGTRSISQRDSETIIKQEVLPDREGISHFSSDETVATSRTKRASEYPAKRQPSNTKTYGDIGAMSIPTIQKGFTVDEVPPNQSSISSIPIPELLHLNNPSDLAQTYRQILPLPSQNRWLNASRSVSRSTSSSSLNSLCPSTLASSYSPEPLPSTSPNGESNSFQATISFPLTNSSPTMQQVHSKFINEQPSDSESSPSFTPLKMPGRTQLNVFGRTERDNDPKNGFMALGPPDVQKHTHGISDCFPPLERASVQLANATSCLPLSDSAAFVTANNNNSLARTYSNGIVPSRPLSFSNGGSLGTAFGTSIQIHPFS